MTRAPAFPASRELYRLVRAVADERDPRERLSDAEIGRMVGLESARTSRWKHGQIALDDAPRLLALAHSFDIDVTVLNQVAAGYLTAEEALDLSANEMHLVRFLGEQQVLSGDNQALVITASNGAQARVVRRSAGHYDRSFRRGGRAPLTREEQEVVVLLADEDPLTREVFGNLTGKGTGITGVATTSGPAALIAAGQLRPRIAIFDLFIGEVDGFAAIRALASHQATGATTVIATSLAVTPDIVRAAKGSGASEVLQRPLRARSLGRLLRNLRRGQ